MFDDKKPYVSPYSSALDAIADYEPMIKAALDSKLNGEDSSLNDSIGFSLDYDKAFVWLQEPCHTVLDIDFKEKVERILTSLLYPEFTLLHSSGIQIVPRSGAGIGAANSRALVFDLKFGLFDRLVLNSLGGTSLLSWSDEKKRYLIPMMAGYEWDPISEPHVAISGNTGSGKTSQIIVLNSFCRTWADQTFVDSKKEPAKEPKKIPTLLIIDPKIDTKLRQFSLGHDDIAYLAPDLMQTSAAYMAAVNNALKSVIDEMNYRYTVLAENPDVKFKHFFVTIDESRALLEGADRKAVDAFFQFVDLITLKGRACGISLIMGSQSFLSGKTDGCISTPARDNLSLRILLTKQVTEENARFLFKELSSDQAKSLIIDRDGYKAGVGIISNSTRTIVPYKVPFIKTLR